MRENALPVVLSKSKGDRYNILGSDFMSLPDEKVVLNFQKLFQEAGGLYIWRSGPGEWKQILPISRGALFPPYVYAFFFPYVCDSSLAQAPSVRGAGEMDGWEGCMDGETVAAVMWCNSWHLHKDGEFREPWSGGNSPGNPDSYLEMIWFSVRPGDH